MIQRRRPGSGWLVPWIFSLACVAGAARAQAPSVSWSAPEGCPGEPALRARVAQLLAQSTMSTPLGAVGTITRQGGGYALSLELDQGGHHASRTLEGSDCASLAEAAAFLIAVTVDPNLTPPPEPPPPEPAAKPEPRQEPQPPPPPPQDDEERDSPWVQGYRLGLTVGGFHAGLAGPSAELGLAAGLALAWLRLELRFAHVFARTGEPSSEGVQGRFDSQHLGLAACPEWGGRVRGGPCVWAAAVRTHATTVGLEDGRDLSLFWALAGLSLGGRVRLKGPLELSLEGGVGVPLSARPSFVVEGVGTIGEVAYLSGYVRLGIGLELR